MWNAKAKKVKTGMSDKCFNTILMVIATLVLLTVLYPIIYIISNSFSSAEAVASGRVYLWPVDFSTTSYKWVLQNRMIWSGCKNSINYTVGATILHLFMTICAAYPLSRKNYQAKGFIQKYFVASMLLGGGLLPLFLLVSRLGLYNKPLWIFLSGAVAINHIIILRTFFQSNIPYELFEAARMDGISDYGYLIKIVLPLSKVAIAVIGLYTAVGTWNSFMTPILYLRNRELYPLQLVINEMLLQVTYGAKYNATYNATYCMIAYPKGFLDTAGYATLVIGVAPLLILFPLLRKFLEKGVTMGVVKG